MLFTDRPIISAGRLRTEVAQIDFVVRIPLADFPA
jgi:hypothetical protein